MKIPLGSRVIIRDQAGEGTVIGHSCDEFPIIRIDRLVVSNRDIITYTDEDGNVRIMEEPIT